MRTTTTRQAAAIIAQAYADAAELLARVDAEATGSGMIIDITGGGTPRLVGATENFGHLADHPHHFTVPTTGAWSWRLGFAVDGLAGRRVGQARATERRSAVISAVQAELTRRSEAAGLDPEYMLSSGVRVPIHAVATELVDYAIGQITSSEQGRTAPLTAAALALVDVGDGEPGVQTIEHDDGEAQEPRLSPVA